MDRNPAAAACCRRRPEPRASRSVSHRAALRQAALLPTLHALARTCTTAGAERGTGPTTHGGLPPSQDDDRTESPRRARRGPAPCVGSVVQLETQHPAYAVLDPAGSPVESVMPYLRDLALNDNSTATSCSHANNLLGWFRFRCRVSEARRALAHRSPAGLTTHMRLLALAGIAPLWGFPHATCCSRCARSRQTRRLPCHQAPDVVATDAVDWVMCPVTASVPASFSIRRPTAHS